MQRLIIDTDPGVDDALAILLALALPDIQVEALTIVAGNVGADLAARNALLTIDAAGSTQLPAVALGAVKPLERDAVDAVHIHGADGLGGAAAELGGTSRAPVGTHAVDLLLETISSNPHEITVVTLGPLTNLALAFLSDPGTMALAEQIVIMGGALRAPGNATPTAEYNFYVDPEAARIVLGSSAPITLVGLDVTTRTRIRRDEMTRRALGSVRPGAAFAERICRRYFDIRELQSGRPECLLHDPLAMGVALDRSFVQTERFFLDVETEGRLTTGMLVADLREGEPRPSEQKGVAVAVDVDEERFVDFFLDRVFG